MDLNNLHTVLDWITNHPDAAHAVVFTVAMAESFFIVGMLVPGAAMMIGFGALVGAGVLEIGPTLLWATLGAIAGDGISFWLGYYFRDRIENLAFFKKRKAILDRGKVFFKKHGGKSVVLGRFIGPIRAVIPTVAGMMQMSPWKFTLVNVISAIAWAPAYLLPGIIVGTSLTLATQIATRLSVVTILLITVGWIVVKITKWIVSLLDQYADRVLYRVIEWCHGHRFVGKLTLTLFDPRLSPIQGLAFWTIIFSASFFLVAYSIALALGVNTFEFSDNLHSFIQNFRAPWFDRIAFGLALAARFDTALYVAIAFSIASIGLKNRKLSLYFISSALVALVFTLIASAIESDQAFSNFEYPIYQFAFATVVYGMLAIILSNRETIKLRRWIYGFTVIYVLSTTLSTIYLGLAKIEYAVGGIGFGFVWLSLVGLAFRRHMEKGADHRKTFQTIAVSVGSIWIGTSVIHYQNDLEEIYRLQEPPHAEYSVERLTNEWRTFVTKRIDFGGHQAQILNMVVVANERTLENMMRSANWVESPPKTFAKELISFNSKSVETAIPSPPLLHRGRFADLSFKYLSKEGEQLVMRLWQERRRFENGDLTVYVGNIVTQSVKKTIGGFPIVHSSDAVVNPREIVTNIVKPFNATLQSDAESSVLLIIERE